MPIINKKIVKKRLIESSKKDNNNHKYVYNTKRWKELRQTYLLNNPLCYECQLKGYYVSAIDVHHIQPISKFKDIHKKMEMGFNINNLKGLCKECHKAEHQKRNCNYIMADEIEKLKKLIEDNNMNNTNTNNINNSI